ncbi:MAG TPA: TonB family protein, partial [Pyrinomonadaceae bacterium]|nr:TonB family protein [Pyrinomonadaceae bacterium]
ENTFEAALDIYKKIPDLDKQNGEAFAELLELLAFIKFQKQADSAEKLYETALIWREKTDGADSLKTARALSGLAAISFQKKEYKKAARFYQRVLDVLTKNSAAGNRAASGDEITLIYYRTECAFRKAEMEQEFEPLKEKYRQQITLKTKSEADKTNGAREPQVVNKGILNGNAVSLPKPVYPDEARKFRAEGVVEVHVIIDERGKVIYACAARSDHFALNAAAETAAYQARFSPTQFEGKPVRVFGRIAYNFRVR